jgi:hypothetical protein
MQKVFKRFQDDEPEKHGSVDFRLLLQFRAANNSLFQHIHNPGLQFQTAFWAAIP